MNTIESTNHYKLSKITHLVGGGITVISAFLPAVTAFGISVTFLNHPKGMGFAIFLFVAAIIAAAVGLVKKRWLHILSLIAAISLIGFAALMFDAGAEREVPVGIGVWGVLIGGIAVFAGAVLGMMRK